MPALHESHINELPLLHRGKVRDMYAVGDEYLLMVATDRLSAFDVVLPDPIPDKGRILTGISNFWFDRTSRLAPNHLTGIPVDDVLSDRAVLEQLQGRASVVRRLTPLPLEAIVRGYLIGSGWKDYQRDGAVSGVPLPGGLRLADRLPEPVFTPSTKGAPGEHDTNIDLAAVAAEIGGDLASEVRARSLAIYEAASKHARDRGIIIADTKFEFGVDAAGNLLVMDEMLTPDSSRFWPTDQYAPGASPPSFDKQFVRDYLETLDWNKQPPGPKLPPDIIRRTAVKYREAFERLTGKQLET